ncbi:MAG: ABC transporter permease [Deltaproteobacteria bacterium]|nr:ABC transporter permease [Deltaproteobacteria bacterium]
MSRLRLAWIQFRGQIGQLATAVVVIALGVALAAGMLLANAGLRESFQESAAALAGRAELEVAPLSGGTFDEGTLDLVRGTPGVEMAVPLLLGSALLDDESETRLRLVGVDMLDDATVRLYRSSATATGAVDDPLVFLNQPDSAMVAASFLEERDLERGGTLSIQTPSGRRNLVIRGVLDDVGVGRAFGGEFAIMDLFSAQETLGQEGRLTRIDVAVENGVSPSAVANSLRKVLPNFVGVVPVTERKAELERAAVGFQALLNVLAFMGLLLGSLITANRLATVYQERMWEMGVLRGMGWTPTALVRDLLVEAAIVGTVAVAIGLPLGVFFAQLIAGPVADTMALNLQQSIAKPHLSLRPLPLVVAGLAGIGSGVLSACIPARRASRAPIVVLKARKRRRDPFSTPTWTRIARVLTPALGLAALLAQSATNSPLLGGLAMLLLAAAGGLLVQPALRVVTPIVGRIFGEAALIGAKDQSRAPSRAIGAATMILVGIGLVVWIGMVRVSFERYVTDINMRVRQADIIVDSSIGGLAVDQSQPRLSEVLLHKLREVPGVHLVGSDAEIISHNPEAGVLAVDPVRLLHEKFGTWHLEKGSMPGALQAVAAGDGSLADSTLLTKRGLRIGDQVEIMTPSGPLELPIVGVTSAGFLSGEGNLTISREVYRKYWQDHSIVRAYLLVSDGHSIEEVRRAIQADLGTQYRLRTVDADELGEWIGGSVRRAFIFLDVIAVLTVIVVFAGTADALAANVIERTREIGTLRSIGHAPAAIGKMVVAQALVIGIAGAALAAILGVGMGFAFVAGVLQSILGWQLEVYPTFGAPAAAATLGVLACVLGGTLPAIRASRLSIVHALRYE